MTAAALLVIAVAAVAPRTPLVPIADPVATASSPLHRLLNGLVPAWPPSVVASMAIGGALILSASFLLGLHHARRGTVSLRTILILAVLANSTVALLPLLGSRDVFSYLMQGRLFAVHGLNPYTGIAADVPSDPFFPFVDPMWRGVPSPYGPLFIWGASLAAQASPAVGVLISKLVACAAVLVTLWLVVRISDRFDGRRTSDAAVLVGLNPVMILSVVGAGHNDGLVALSIASAIASATTPRRVRRPLLYDAATFGFLTAAALIKPVVAVALPLYLAARRAPPTARSRTTSLLLVALPGAVLAVAASLPFVRDPGAVLSVMRTVSGQWNFLSPAALPIVLTRLASWHPPSSEAALRIVTLLPLTFTLLAAVMLTLAAARRSRSSDVERLCTLSLILFLVAVSLPSFNHWYLAWVAPLIWAARRPFRAAFVSVCAVAPLIDAIARPTPYGVAYVAVRGATWAVAVPILVSVLILGLRDSLRGHPCSLRRGTRKPSLD